MQCAEMCSMRWRTMTQYINKCIINVINWHKLISMPATEGSTRLDLSRLPASSHWRTLDRTRISTKMSQQRNHGISIDVMGTWESWEWNIIWLLQHCIDMHCWYFKSMLQNSFNRGKHIKSTLCATCQNCEQRKSSESSAPSDRKRQTLRSFTTNFPTRKSRDNGLGQARQLGNWGNLYPTCIAMSNTKAV